MEDLDKEEQKALLYFSGIKALEKNICDNYISKLDNKCDYENLLFVILFYLIVVITNSNEKVRKVVLKCKEDELIDEYEYTDEDIEKYIDEFNNNFKDLSMKFLEISKSTAGDDEKFQNELVSEFALTLMNRLKVNNDEIKSGLKKELVRALMVGFEFK